MTRETRAILLREGALVLALAGLFPTGPAHAVWSVQEGYFTEAQAARGAPPTRWRAFA